MGGVDGGRRGGWRKKGWVEWMEGEGVGEGRRVGGGVDGGWVAKKIFLHTIPSDCSIGLQYQCWGKGDPAEWWAEAEDSHSPRPGEEPQDPPPGRGHLCPGHRE